jgi:energy-coupling factor transporter ATP-binding protein EcfA2
MTFPALTNISIENLRGSVTPFTLSFEKGKKLVIIYGENGTGKSTVADAFDFLGNGEVGSLDTRGLGATRRYWPSIGKKAADVKVTLETTGGSCSVSLGKSDVVVSNEALRPEVAVLRRAQILRLIEAKPADRYKEIGRFIDVTGVEASEGTLRKLILDKENEYNTASTRVSENRAAIEGFWREALSPGTSATAWAKQEVQRDQAQIDLRKAVVDRLMALWDKVVLHPQKVIDLDIQLKNAETACNAAQQELASLEGTMASDYLEVLDILKAAQVHFRSHPNPSVCPLCESSENVDSLVAEVNRRIESQDQHNKLESAKQAAVGKARVVELARQRLEDARRAAATDAAAFQEYCMGGDVPADIPIPVFPIAADPTQWNSWIVSHQEKRNQWARTAEACVADKKFIGALRTSLNTLKENEQRAKELEVLIPRLKQVLELIERERKRFTDAILSAISVRVGELYEAIHPGEGLNKIVLALEEGKRASLEIAADFGGNPDSPPQAYFSDSHLDTLGLCVFLALAERDAPENKLLVLDDVLGSVDEPHVERIIEMIYDAISKFRHCIVTTHYGPWRHKYRWGWLKNGQCQFVELSRWSLQKGISHSRSIPEVERLRTMLSDAAPDHQAICAKAGVILEAILDFLTQLYECSVPRKSSGTYTLGELLPAIDGKLRKSLRVEHRHEDSTGAVTYIPRMLETHLVELARIAQVRNVMGCHFNALSFDLLDSDALAFGAEVLALADALIDREVGWPRNGKSGSYWATAGETRRLHPLKKPS